MASRAPLAKNGCRSLISMIKEVQKISSLGSELFEEITKTPEYYLTSKELGLLTDHSLEIRDALDVEVCFPLISRTQLWLNMVTQRDAYLQDPGLHRKQRHFYVVG